MTSFKANRLSDLDRILKIIRGFPTQHAAPEGDVRVMSIAALRTETPPKLFADRNAISDIGLETAQTGDILIAVEGGTVGETMVVPAGIDEFVPSQQVATLRVVDTTSLDPWYLGAWFSTEPARDQVRRLARGTAIQRIPVTDLASLTVMIPPQEDQREIGARYQAFENAIKEHRAVTTCLQDLRDADLIVTFADAHVHDIGDAQLKAKRVAADGR